MERNIYILDISLVIDFPLYNVSNPFVIKGTEYNKPVLYVKEISKVVIYMISSTSSRDVNIMLTI